MEEGKNMHKKAKPEFWFLKYIVIFRYDLLIR